MTEKDIYKQTLFKLAPMPIKGEEFFLENEIPRSKLRGISFRIFHFLFYIEVQALF